MWFSSKSVKKKSSTKGKAHFLRKALPRRREGRVLISGNKHRFRILISVLLLWLSFFATLCYVAFFSLFFLTGAPRMSGTDQLSEEALLLSVENQLAGKYLGIFPKRNFFLIRPRTLEAYLQREYPLLASVAVTRIFPDGLSLRVTEREKIILWCVQGSFRRVSHGGGDAGEMIEIEENVASVERGCFLIDEAGRAGDASRALLAENIHSVLFVTDTSGRAVSQGERVFDPSYGAFVIRLNELFPEQLGMDLRVEYTTVSRFANEVRATTSEGWEAYVNSEIPIETSLNTLRLLFEKELPAEKRTQLSYIDLRTENRVYYAFREGEDGKEEANTESATVDSSVQPTKEKKAAEPKKSKQ